MTDTGFTALRRQLDEAAAAFAPSHEALSAILLGLVDDVERAMAEPLEIFPVCHHSPASGVAMIRRLREKAPKVIYLELCDDMRDIVPELRNCELPVALQAFAARPAAEAGPGPLAVVAPLSEASAEYQAIAYAMDSADVELVFVDRSTDHVFTWEKPEAEPEPDRAPGPDDDGAIHGDAVGIDIGDLRPRFRELERYLLHHGKVRHWSEWWDQFVEQPLVGADYNTYRQVMTLIGSLFRRLTPDGPRLTVDENRERYMWTRIREHLAASGADPADCLYVCGAFHAASHVPEFGLEAPPTDFVIPPPTRTEWKYGLIPSSYSAIEAQFSLAPGSVSIAAATWKKSLQRGRIKPFRLERKTKTVKASTRPNETGDVASLGDFLAEPKPAGQLDEDELRSWCVDIVRLARKNGYLASTADAIAVFETSVLLAGLRNRARPTPYDFADAAVTCIEKDTVPGRRDVRRLCEILLGGDRLGKVGYDSLPPLARDVLDRLAPLGVNGDKKTVQRVLIDLKTNPEQRAASKLLWMLRSLLPVGTVRNIMGACTLEEQSIQESWDVAIGRNLRPLIELGYLGVTVEQVLEQRLRRNAWHDKATAASVLAAIEDAIVHLDNRGLVNELGARAVELLGTERTVDDAPEVLRRIRRLLAYYRTRDDGLPEWTELFVTTGYGHYCTLLPAAFADADTGIRQVGAMIGFLVTMEGLALSLGCDRSQLEIAVKQSRPGSPAKIALQWATRFQLGELPLEELRGKCDSLLDNPLSVAAFPDYISGFVQALEAIPRLAPFVVELMSSAFARLPDHVLLPWLPGLISTLKEQAGDMMPVLVREAGLTFPGRLDAIDEWTPPWTQAATVAETGAVGGVGLLLDTHRGATDAVAELLGVDGQWQEPAAGLSRVSALLEDHPASAAALAALIA